MADAYRIKKDSDYTSENHMTYLYSKRLIENHQIVVCDYVIEELRLVTERKSPTKEK